MMFIVATLFMPISTNVHADEAIDIHKLEEVAEQGGVAAQTLLGLIYEYGKNVKQKGHD